jgi:hypothetical protein
MEMQAADVENPNNHAAADTENPNNHNAAAAATAARAEPDVQSQFGMVCCRACNGCTLLALAAFLVVISCLIVHTPSMFGRGRVLAGIGRVLAGFDLVIGIGGLARGVYICANATNRCIHGNPQGRRQVEAPHVAA